MQENTVQKKTPYLEGFHALSVKNSNHKLRQPFCKTSTKVASLLALSGLELWNKIKVEIKRTSNFNNFKHGLQK